MSVMGQLRDSGLFDEYRPDGKRTVRFVVTGWKFASIWVLKNDREVHIRESAFTAFGKGRFPNNDRLHEFVHTRARPGVRFRSESDPTYILDAEHIPEVIEIIRTGMEGALSI